MPLQIFSSKKVFIFDAIILFILYALTYFYHAGTYPLFSPDESRYSEAAWEMIASQDYITPHVNGITFLDKPILFYWLQVASIKIFGLTEWAVRFMPLLFGITTCLFTYLTTCFLYDRKTGLIAACILAYTPLFFCSAHYANLDMEVAFWISSALFAFISGLKFPLYRKRLFCCLYICSGFAFLTKGAIAILPFIIALSWLASKKQWQLLHEIISVKNIFIWLCIVLPWLVMVQLQNKNFLNHFFIMQHFQRFLSTGVFNNQLPWWFYLPVVLLGGFPWSLFFIAGLKEIINIKNDEDIFFIVWLATIFLFFSLPSAKIITYILPLFPPLAILTARYLSHAWNFSTNKHSKLICVCLFCTGTVISLLLSMLASRLEHDTFTFINLISSITVIASGIAFSYRNQINLRTLFYGCLFVSLILLLLLMTNTQRFNAGSSKPLLMRLKSSLQPEDMIVSYFNFYYDAPFYLKHKIKIVNDWNNVKLLSKDNWAREFYLGKMNDKHKMLISELELALQWNSNKRVYSLMDQKNLARFKAAIGRYFEIAQYDDTVLITNIRPTQV